MSLLQEYLPEGQPASCISVRQSASFSSEGPPRGPDLAAEPGSRAPGDGANGVSVAIINGHEPDEITPEIREPEIEPTDTDIEPGKTNSLETLDDPVRVYLKQLHRFSILLTREGEVEVCRRMEAGEEALKRVMDGFGFAGKEYVAIAEKLLAEPPAERFDRVIAESKLPERQGHLTALSRLIKQARTLDKQMDEKYSTWVNATSPCDAKGFLAELSLLDKQLQDCFAKFCYKQKVFEEMALVAGNVQQPDAGLSCDEQSRATPEFWSSWRAQTGGIIWPVMRK